MQVYCPGAEVVHVEESLFHECEGLDPETAYNVSVSAENGGGESPIVTVSATTTCTPPSPQLTNEGGVVTITIQDNCRVR